MSEPIKVGDLVVYTRSCCMGYREGINIFRVSAMHAAHAPYLTCQACKASIPVEPFASRAMAECGAPISWLKRIPDFPELADERHDEEITA